VRLTSRGRRQVPALNCQCCIDFHKISLDDTARTRRFELRMQVAREAARIVRAGAMPSSTTIASIAEELGPSPGLLSWASCSNRRRTPCAWPPPGL
jgi:hypothetical protein